MTACRLYYDPFQHPTLQRGSRYEALVVLRASCTAGKKEKVSNCLLGSKLSLQDETLVGEKWPFTDCRLEPRRDSEKHNRTVHISRLQDSLMQPCANICHD